MGAIFVGGVKIEVQGATFKIEVCVLVEICDKFEIVVELVCDGWSVAIAKDVMSKTGDYHHGDKEGDWDNTKEASVGVLRENSVPFLDSITNTVGSEDCNWEDNQEGGIWVEAREEDSEDGEVSGD